MNNIKLFIENYEVDIDNSTQIYLTYRFSNLTDITTITGDYSKTITIKGTSHNNNIFGLIYRLDRERIDNLSGKNTNTSISFNASKRTRAKILINDTVLKDGYVKLNKILIKNGVISYEITFYSEMCNVLNYLNEQKVVDLPFENNLTHIINRHNINNFWNGNHILQNSMTYVMTNSGLYDNFQSDKWLTRRNLIEDITTNGFDYDEISKREYRSQYQRPALKMDNLLDLIVDSYNRNSDSNITLKLDENLFNGNNPYYSKMYLLLPRMNTQSEAVVKSYEFNQASSTINATDDGFEEWSELFIDVPLNDSEDGIVTNGTINLNETSIDTIQVEAELEINGIINAIFTDNRAVGLLQNNNFNLAQPIRIGAQLVSDNGEVYDMERFSIVDTQQTYLKGYEIYHANESDCEQVFIKPNSTSSITTFEIQWKNHDMPTMYDENGYLSNKEIELYTNYKDDVDYLDRWPVHFKTKLVGDMGQMLALRFKIQVPKYVTQDKLFVPTWNVRINPITAAPANAFDTWNYYPVFGINNQYPFNGNAITVSTSTLNTSNRYLNKNDIINSQLTQGELLISLSKLFGWIWDTETQGEITIKSRNTYFSDYKILDWNDKLDTSKDIHIAPLSFDFNNINMKYESLNSNYESYYKSKFGTEYGELKAVTGYEFSNGTKNLLDGTLFSNTICSKASTIYNVNDNIVATVDDKILPSFFTMNSETTRESINANSYHLVFDLGLENLQSPIYITDDDELMFDASIANSGKPCWYKVDDWTNLINTPIITRMNYRRFGTFDKSTNLSLDIGYPRENYEYLSSTDYTSSATIYNNFWKNYLSEIYNNNNKVMTCYLKINNDDIHNFKFNSPIYLNNALWMINQIIDYNPIGTDVTKVEMLQISSPNAIKIAYQNGQKNFS